MTFEEQDAAAVISAQDAFEKARDAAFDYVKANQGSVSLYPAAIEAGEEYLRLVLEFIKMPEIQASPEALEHFEGELAVVGESVSFMRADLDELMDDEPAPAPPVVR